MCPSKEFQLFGLTFTMWVSGLELQGDKIQIFRCLVDTKDNSAKLSRNETYMYSSVFNFTCFSTSVLFHIFIRILIMIISKRALKELQERDFYPEKKVSSRRNILVTNTLNSYFSLNLLLYFLTIKRSRMFQWNICHRNKTVLERLTNMLPSTIKRIMHLWEWSKQL